MKLKNKWRVVSVEHGGFNIQKKFWWLPFSWLTETVFGEYVTYSSVEEAMQAIKKDYEFENTPKFKPKVVATYESEG